MATRRLRGQDANGRDHDPAPRDLSPDARRRALEQEMAELRVEIGLLVHEIERRMRQAVSVRRQVRRHPAVAVGGLLVVTVVVVVGIRLEVRRRRELASRSRWTNLRIALAHLMVHPEDVTERRGHPARDRLLGAGKAVGVFGAKRMARRVLSG